MFCFVALSLLSIILCTVLDALGLATRQDGTTCQMENTFAMLVLITCIAGMDISLNIFTLILALLQIEIRP